MPQEEGCQWSHMVVQEVRPQDPAKVLLMRRADAVDVCPREILQAIHAKGHAWTVDLLQVVPIGSSWLQSVGLAHASCGAEHSALMVRRLALQPQRSNVVND